MSNNGAVVEAFTLVVGALADRMRPSKRRKVLADLRAGLADARCGETERILLQVIDYLQAREDLDAAAHRAREG